MINVCIHCGIDIPEDAQVCPVCKAYNGASATSPCKGCTTRTLTCHDTCKRYITWARRRQDIMSKMRAVKEKEYLMNPRRRREK